MTIKIRLVEPRDHDAVWQIFYDCVSPGDTYEYDPEVTKEEALAIWINDKQATYVAEHNDDVVGTYMLRANRYRLGAHVANAGYMVAKSARGLGVGRSMATHSFAEATAKGFLAIQYNYVVSTNTVAVELWQKLGFKIIGTIPDGFHHQQRGYIDVHIMWKRL